MVGAYYYNYYNKTLKVYDEDFIINIITDFVRHPDLPNEILIINK